jgi:hypothetical protein
MADRNIFKTLNEAMDAAREREAHIELVIIPPPVDELTDEEDEVRNEVHDIVGEVELVDLDISLHNDEGNETNERKISWRKRNPKFDEIPQTSSRYVQEKCESLCEEIGHLPPIKIFEQFWDGVIHLFKENSELYARQKNEHSYKLADGELERFFGILMLSGYHILPSQQMYWERSEDVSVPVVQASLPRDRYLQIKKWLHAGDNDNLDATDRLTKIRPFLDLMKKNILRWGIHSEHLSIDESMVPYFGRCGLKMFLKGKPVRFGYKIWCLCDSQGFLYNFDVYTGRKSNQPVQKTPLGTRVVRDMVSVIPHPSSHMVFFDNFFTSPELLIDLREAGFRTSGTIRENRCRQAPLQSHAQMKKKPRGFYETCTERGNNICIVKWHDNSPVGIASNFEGPLPESTCTRWSAKEKKRITVSYI